MGQLAYRLFPTGAGWAWEVIHARVVMDEGVAPTMRKARVEAVIAVASLLPPDEEPWNTSFPASSWIESPLMSAVELWVSSCATKTACRFAQWGCAATAHREELPPAMSEDDENLRCEPL
jgi:hypothetical protein